MLYISHTVHAQPYTERWMLYLETFNEATLLAVLWASMVFLGYQEVSGRVARHTGWVCAGVTAINVVVNVTVIICKVVAGLEEGCGRRKVVQIKEAVGSMRDREEVTNVQELSHFENRHSSIRNFFPAHNSIRDFLPAQNEAPPQFAFIIHKKSGTVNFTGPSHDFRTQFDLSYEPSLFHKEG